MRRATLSTTLITATLMLAACSSPTADETESGTPLPATPNPAPTSMVVPDAAGDLAAAKADAKTVATQVETYFTQYQEYPAILTQEGDSVLIQPDDPEPSPLSPDTTLTYRLGKDGEAFCIVAINNGQTAVYASDNNGIQSEDGLTPASYCDTYTMPTSAADEDPTPAAASIAMITDGDVSDLLGMGIFDSSSRDTDTSRETTWIGALSTGEDITATVQVIPQQTPEGTSWMDHGRTSIEDEGYELVELFKSQYTAKQSNGGKTTYITVRDAYPYDIRAIIVIPTTADSYSSIAAGQMLANMQQQLMGIE